MPRLRRLAVGLTLALCGAGAFAAEWKVPPITGELSGDFTPLGVANAPTLHWRFFAEAIEDDLRDVTLTVEGPGARWRANARVDAKGNGTWRLDAAEIDLGPWFPVVAARMPDAIANLKLAGVLRASGEGTLRDGTLGGKMHVSVSEGRIDDPAYKLLLEGITLDFALDDLLSRRSPAKQQLAWKAGRYDVLTLGAGHIEFALDGDQVHVERAAVAAMAGDLEVGSFDFALSDPKFTVTADLRHAELAMFVPFLPSAVSEAHGRVDGTVTLSRDATGIHIGTGGFHLTSGESATVKFVPNGLSISSSLPGPLRKSYPGLQAVEEGKIAFDADRLEIAFTPQGDAEGRTAVVHLAGGRKAQAPLDLDVNVRGPLEWLVNLGTDSRLHFR